MVIANLHPVFTHSPTGSLYVHSDEAATLHRYLLGCLSREPNNLRFHVQLIFSLIQKENVARDEVFGALLDLFIVLKDRGLPLRQRMLAVATPFITSEDVEFFKKNLESGLGARVICANTGHSLFAEGYVGATDFIEQAIQIDNQQTLSVYEQALSLLEYGELDEAAVLLAQALKQDPDKEQIAEELLAIYMHQEDYTAIDAIRDWYLERDIELPSCWPLL